MTKSKIYRTIIIPTKLKKSNIKNFSCLLILILQKKRFLVKVKVTIPVPKILEFIVKFPVPVPVPKKIEFIINNCNVEHNMIQNMHYISIIMI